MAHFAQYAMASTEEALEDAGWKPTAFEEREATVGSLYIYLSVCLLDGANNDRECAWAPELGISTRFMILLLLMIRGYVVYSIYWEGG